MSTAFVMLSGFEVSPVMADYMRVGMSTPLSMTGHLGNWGRGVARASARMVPA